MKTFAQLGIEIGALVERKNAAYGSSFAVAGDFLRLLFPDGIPPDCYDDALLLVRIFDKQMRIATDKDAFGESPFQDIAGYGILGVHLHQQKDSTTWPGSASAQDASSSSKAQPASADNSTSETTTTSASATSGGKLLQQLKDSLALCEDAPAETATEAASVSEGARLRYERNSADKCARCSRLLLASSVRGGYSNLPKFQYCSFICAELDKANIWPISRNTPDPRRIFFGPHRWNEFQKCRDCGISASDDPQACKPRERV